MWKPQDRKIFNILTKDEVRSRIYNTISSLTSQQINLKFKTCSACGYEGDERLKPLTCHGNFTQTHKQGNLCPTHSPNSLGKRHFGSLKVVKVHKGNVIHPHPLNLLSEPHYECCKRSPNSDGCHEKEVMTCCEKPEKPEGCQPFHTCCGRKEDAEGCQEHYPCCEGLGKYAPGCVKRCTECQGLWGTPAKENICTGRHEFESKHDVNHES